MGEHSRATDVSLSLCETNTVTRPFPCSSVIPTQRICFRYGVQRGYDYEILISEIEIRPALYDCSLKEYSDKGLKERLWGKVCEGKDGKAGHYEESQKKMVF